MKQEHQIDKIRMQYPDDHVQVTRSSIDGYAWIQIFLAGRRVRTITIGPRGGIRSERTEYID